MSDIPQWAIERAQDLISSACIPGEHYAIGTERAFAAYIAAHEEPPVDPLVDALADAMLCVFEDGFSGWAPAIAEYAPKLLKELTSRGIEIGDQS